MNPLVTRFGTERQSTGPKCDVLGPCLIPLGAGAGFESIRFVRAPALRQSGPGPGQGPLLPKGQATKNLGAGVGPIQKPARPKPVGQDKPRGGEKLATGPKG